MVAQKRGIVGIPTYTIYTSLSKLNNNYHIIHVYNSNWLLKYLSSDVDDVRPILRDYGSLRVRRNSDQVPIIYILYIHSIYDRVIITIT